MRKKERVLANIPTKRYSKFIKTNSIKRGEKGEKWKQENK